MTPAIKLRWYYSICIAFVIIQSIAVILNYPWVGLLPLTLIVVFLFVFKLDKLLLVLNFLIPISVNIPDIGFGLGISIPDEPLIIGIMMLSVFKFIIDAQYDYTVFKHPVTIAIGLNIAWLIFTTCTSQYPLISLKFVISRFWFVVVFYFLALMFFRQFKNIYTYIWAYMIPLFGVILYTLYNHSFVGFSLARSYTIMQPFFVDHGVYAATISLFIPFLGCSILFYRKMGLSIFTIVITVLFLIVFLIGIYFSYTRAAWIGIMAAIGFIIPVLLRIRLNTILIIAIGLITTAFVFQDQILYIMAKNDQKSAQGFFKHFQSISNIKTDPSNTERINRWMCAVSMFEEKPVLGFGPGTY